MIEFIPPVVHAPTWAERSRDGKAPNGVHSGKARECVTSGSRERRQCRAAGELPIGDGISIRANGRGFNRLRRSRPVPGLGPDLSRWLNPSEHELRKGRQYRRRAVRFSSSATVRLPPTGGRRDWPGRRSARRRWQGFWREVRGDWGAGRLHRRGGTPARPQRPDARRRRRRALERLSVRCSHVGRRGKSRLPFHRASQARQRAHP